MEPMYVARKTERNNLSYVDFSKTCDGIKSCTELKKKENKKLPLLSHQVQERLNG